MRLDPGADCQADGEAAELGVQEARFQPVFGVYTCRYKLRKSHRTPLPRPLEGDEEAARIKERPVAGRDQELARLFQECGWTQERIARRIGKTKAWVSYRLIFGRFLEFSTTVEKLETLTERRFRDQELSRLFRECGPTQERIAKRMGKRQTWVCQKLIFGRFLDFIAAAINTENLTERRFRDQELSRLFRECGWTQERIAKRMGKPQNWVSRRLIFGRFLEFTPSGVSVENLTEGRFRNLWKATKGSERERFEQVLSMNAARPRSGLPSGWGSGRHGCQNVSFSAGFCSLIPRD
jgi:transcriptional regulator with XRE-family HTH domain